MLSLTLVHNDRFLDIADRQNSKRKTQILAQKECTARQGISRVLAIC
jgi:hypothetical protein